MRKILIASFTLLSLTPVLAAAQEPVRFVRDGVQYEYVTLDRADGSRVITGRNLSTRQSFKLVVRGRDVSGTFGSSEVAFRAPAVAAQTRIASSR